MEFRGRRVTVMGLGRHGGGVAAAGWLAEQAPSSPSPTRPRLIRSPIHCTRWLTSILPPGAWRGHRRGRFRQRRSGSRQSGGPARHPLVDRARPRGVPITSELELFLERCPVPMIGVTGSNGKSTTAAMIARHSARRRQAGFLGWQYRPQPARGSGRMTRRELDGARNQQLSARLARRRIARCPTSGC